MIVLFGATGDLARRKLLPGMFHLAEAGLMPERFIIIGASCSDLDDTQFACGVAWRQLPIEGFDCLAGKGISYGAARSEASNTHGLDVHIVGAGNSAGQAALFFSTHAKSVTILCRGDKLEKTAQVESGGLFLFIGANAETEWLPPEIALDRRLRAHRLRDARGGPLDARPRPLPP